MRHFQQHQFAGSERAGLQFAHPVRRVNAQQVFVARRIWTQKIFLCGDGFAEQHFMDEAKFLRWKNMRAEIQIIPLVIHQLEWKKSFHQPERELLFYPKLLTFDCEPSSVLAFKDK